MTKPFKFQIKKRKNKKWKTYLFQMDSRDCDALAAAISTNIPSSATPYTDQMVALQPITPKPSKTIWFQTYKNAKTHPKTTSDVSTCFTKSYETDQNWPSANYQKSKFRQSTRTDHSVAIRPISQNPPTHRVNKQDSTYFFLILFRNWMVWSWPKAMCFWKYYENFENQCCFPICFGRCWDFGRRATEWSVWVDCQNLDFWSLAEGQFWSIS